MKLHLVNLGRNHLNATVETQSADDATIIRAIRKTGALMSRGIDLEWNTQSSGVVLVGGFREVGQFNIKSQ